MTSAAVGLKLLRRPRWVEPAFIGVPSPRAALDLLNMVQERTGGAATTCELIKRIAIEFAVKHGPDCRDPLSAPHPWYVLLELSSSEDHGLRAALEDALAAGAEAGLVADAAVAANLGQRPRILRPHELLTELQKPEGGPTKAPLPAP